MRETRKLGKFWFRRTLLNIETEIQSNRLNIVTDLSKLLPGFNWLE